MVKNSGTISVIGLGTKADSDAAFIEDILDGTDDEHGLNVLFPPVARNGKTIRISFGPKTRTAIEKAKFNHEIRDAVLKHAVAPYITNTN